MIQPRPIRNNDHHYVILVHGTFNKPDKKSPHWCKLDKRVADNFAAMLNKSLAKTSIGEAVNKHLSGIDDTFVWEGQNTHEDRLEAGRLLYKRILKTVELDPNARIHLVGHSHGGNVILSAIQMYYKYLDQEPTHIAGLDWWVWKFGDKKKSFLVNQPTDLSDPAERMVNAINVANDSMLASMWRSISYFFWEQGNKEDERKRAENEYHRYFLASPTYNRLGRIVFLGTPFIYKRWRKGSPMGWLKHQFFNVLGLLFYWGLVGWIIVFLISFLPSLILGHGIPWNPWKWPLVIQAIAAVYVLFNIFKGYEENRRNGNVYCNGSAIEQYELDLPVELASIGRQTVDGRLSALTVTAPYFDEAFLAMSSDSLLFGKLKATLREFLIPARAAKKDDRLPSGIRVTRMVALRVLVVLAMASAGRLLMKVIYKVFLEIPWKIIYLSLVEKLMLKNVFGAISAASTGLPGSEFKEATIEVHYKADAPELLNESILDGGSIFEQYLQTPATGKASRSSAATRRLAGAYSFLKDDQELARRLLNDQQWNEIEPHLLSVSKFLERDDFKGFSYELGKKWLSIKERTSSILESVTLNHSRYYADQQIIDGIAEFIATGQVSSAIAGTNDITFDKTWKKPTQTVKPAGNNEDVKIKLQATGLPHTTPALMFRGQPGEAPTSEREDLQRCLSDLVNHFEWLTTRTAINTTFITNELYQFFVTEGRGTAPIHWYGNRCDPRDKEQPVSGIAPGDASRFCDWLTEVFKARILFRLPTEEEARQQKASNRHLFCWATREHSDSKLIGAKRLKRAYAALIKHAGKAKVPFSATWLNYLETASGDIHFGYKAEFCKMICRLIAKAMFNQALPENREDYPRSLYLLWIFFLEMKGHTINVTNAKEKAGILLSELTDALTQSSVEPVARAFTEWQALVAGARHEEAALLMAQLSASASPEIAHPAHMVIDIVQAADAPDSRLSCFYLHRAAARMVAYAYAGYRFFEVSKRKKIGWVPYWYQKYIGIYFKMGDLSFYYDEIWFFYWWFRLIMERAEHNIGAIEGIRIVYTGNADYFEKVKAFKLPDPAN